MDVEAWFEALPAQVAEAARGEFTALTRGVAADDVAAFGIWSDPGAMTLVCGVCLNSDIEATIAQMPDMTWDDVRWETGEWTRTSYDLPESVTGELDRIQEEMNAVRSRVSDGEIEYDDPGALKYMVWQVGAIAMAELFEDGFFDEWDDAVQVFQVSDEDLEQETLVEWIEMCNTDEATAEYEAYLQSVS